MGVNTTVVFADLTGSTGVFETLGNAKARNFVGSFHEDGWVVERDLARAGRDHRRRAAR